MLKFQEILKGTYEGVVHRKQLFNIFHSNNCYTLDPEDSIYFIFRGGQNFECGTYIKNGRSFFLCCEEPCFYA